MPRISTAQSFAMTKDQIIKSKEKEFETGIKASTQKELQRPSQSPAQYMISADIKDDVNIREGIMKNAAVATHALSATENVLSQAQDIIQKLHELALSTSNTTISTDTAKHVLPEVQGLYDNLLQALNTKYGNRYLLSGYKVDSAAFDANGRFTGDDSEINVEIDRGLKVPINISASKIILGQGVEKGVNIVLAAQTLLEGLKVNDLQKIRGSLDGLNLATNQLSLGRTEIAGRQTAIQRAIDTNAENNIQKKDAVAQMVEADPVKVFSDLAREQTVLKAALESSRKILTETSVDTLFKS